VGAVVSEVMDHHHLVALARRQHGLVSFEQTGRDRHGVDHAITAGRLERVRRGVYRIAGAPRTWEQQVMAAVLAIPASRASHRTAARLSGLEGFDEDLVEVTVRTRQRTRRDGITVHDTAIVGPLHGQTLFGIPCMSVARTLCDLTAVTDRWTVERAVDESLRKRLVGLPALLAVFADLEHPGRHRSTVMRSILEARATGLGSGDSHPEVRLVKLLEAAGLPRPVQQHELRLIGRTVRIDLAYPELRIAIEYDGWEFHSTRSAFDRDRARANELELLGWTVLRFTSKSSDATICRTVRAAIDRAHVS
jgi:very-short-patch-repair endonuclease